MKKQLVQWYIGTRSKVFDPWKEEYFKDLQGPILELGAGYGVNFSWYPEGSDVYVIEPNTKAHSILAQEAQRYDLNLIFINDLDEIKSDSIETVIDTLVLCSVPNPTETVGEIRRVLKIGGSYRSIEHVQAKRGLRKILQNLVNPLWQPVTGCSCVRISDTVIKHSGFESVRQQYFSLAWTFIPWTNRMVISHSVK